MARIKVILYQQQRTSVNGPYWVTGARLEDGLEAEGFGQDFAAGDRVEVFYHDKYNRIKMRKPPLTQHSRCANMKQRRNT